MAGNRKQCCTTTLHMQRTVQSVHTVVFLSTLSQPPGSSEHIPVASRRSSHLCGQLRHSNVVKQPSCSNCLSQPPPPSYLPRSRKHCKLPRCVCVRVAYRAARSTIALQFAHGHFLGGALLTLVNLNLLVLPLVSPSNALSLSVTPVVLAQFESSNTVQMLLAVIERIAPPVPDRLHLPSLKPACGK